MNPFQEMTCISKEHTNTYNKNQRVLLESNPVAHSLVCTCNAQNMPKYLFYSVCMWNYTCEMNFVLFNPESGSVVILYDWHMVMENTI